MAHIQASLLSEHPAGTSHSEARPAVPTETALRPQARDAAHSWRGGPSNALRLLCTLLLYCGHLRIPHLHSRAGLSLLENLKGPLIRQKAGLRQSRGRWGAAVHTGEALLPPSPLSSRSAVLVPNRPWTGTRVWTGTRLPTGPLHFLPSLFPPLGLPLTTVWLAHLPSNHTHRSVSCY